MNKIFKVALLDAVIFQKLISELKNILTILKSLSVQILTIVMQLDVQKLIKLRH